MFSIKQRRLWWKDLGSTRSMIDLTLVWREFDQGVG